jgi:hypothetical protein
MTILIFVTQSVEAGPSAGFFSRSIRAMTLRAFKISEGLGCDIKYLVTF